MPYILAIAIISLSRDRVWLSFLGGVAFTTGIASVLLLIPLIVLNVRWNGFPQRHDLMASAAAVLLVLLDAFIPSASFRLRSFDTAAFIVGMVLTLFYLVGSGVFLTIYPGLAQGFASITPP